MKHRVRISEIYNECPVAREAISLLRKDVEKVRGRRSYFPESSVFVGAFSKRS